MWRGKYLVTRSDARVTGQTPANGSIHLSKMITGAVLVLSCVLNVLSNPAVVDKQHYTRLYGRLLHRKESGTKGTGDETGGLKRDAFPHCPERITETSDDANEQRL